MYFIHNGPNVMLCGFRDLQGVPLAAALQHYIDNEAFLRYSNETYCKIKYKIG